MYIKCEKFAEKEKEIADDFNWHDSYITREKDIISYHDCQSWWRWRCSNDVDRHESVSRSAH